MGAEEEFGIEVTDQEAEKIVTVGQFYDCVMAKLKQADSPWAGRNPDAVWQRLRALIAEQIGVEMKLVVRSARIVDDLHID